MTSAERNFALFILLVFLAVDGALLAATIAAWSDMDPDFFGIWSTGRFLADHDATAAYDIHQLGAFQNELRPRFTAVYPAPYSPIFLLLLRPLGALPYGVAHALFAGASFAAFAAAATALLRQRDLLALLFLCPLMMLNAVYGQTGFLSGALMIGALLLLPARPWAGGICLALLAFKPQLGLLMPVVLLARRDWRGLAATIACLLGLVLLSSAILGWHIWPDWLATLPSHGELITQSRAQLIGIMATVTAGALSLGADPALARIIQISVAAVVAVIVWIAWRRAPRDLALAATLAGGILVTPYAFVYDTPMAMAAALLFLRHCRAAQADLVAPDLFVTLLVLIAPLFILTAPPQPPVAPASLLLLFAAITRRALRPPATPA